MSIEVYKYEEKIADLIRNNTATIAFQLSNEGNFAYASEQAPVADLLKPHSIDRDSMWFPAILVTTNWNRNDDVFSPEEVAKAKETPVNKPINWQHNGDEKKGNEIIGVINSCIPVDDSYTSIPQDVNLAALDKYHLSVGCLIWKQNFPTYGKKIQDGLANNSLFISMESVFPNFGYALTINGRDITLIDRNPDTAWLSQFLRAYKGPGIVNLDGIEYRVGRWLKNITFMGAGIVNQPGNPESIILLDKPVFASQAKFNFQENENKLVKSIINCVSWIGNNNLEGNDIMADNKENKAVACETSAEMEKVKSEFMDKIKAMEEAKVQAEAAQAKAEAELASAKTAIAEVEAKAAKLEASLTQANEAKAKVEAELSVANAQIAESNAKIDNIEKDKIATARMIEAEALGMISNAEEDFKKFRAMDDATFQNIKDFVTKAKASANINSSESIEVDVKAAAEEVSKAKSKVEDAEFANAASAKSSHPDKLAILCEFISQNVVKSKK